VRVHLLLLHCDSCCTRSFHMFLCHGRRMQRVHSEHRSSRDCFVYLPRSNQSARAQESMQPLVWRRRGAICSSILPAAGQWVGGPRGGGVIVVWTSHTTIIQQSYNNPYNNPYNNSFFVVEERILPRDENKKVICLFYRERDVAPRPRKTNCCMDCCMDCCMIVV
jgi:hypothetical protein